MSDLTIHDVPADVVEVLEADASRANATGDEVACQILRRYAQNRPAAGARVQARTQMDRIRSEIERRHGTMNVVMSLLRDDRDR
jgi:hypothetical protein